MADDTPDPAASALDEIRKRGYRKGTAPGLRAGQLADYAADDIPRLLAAIEAALKLADDDDLTTRFHRQRSPWTIKLREAITTALAGKGTD